MKKTISLLLSILITLSVFTALPLSISAVETDIVSLGATSGTTGDCTWVLDDNGVLIISGNGNMKEYYGGDSPWRNKVITEVIFKDGVKNISNYAFHGCASITTITISDSVTSIGECAFLGCTGLTSITIPDSVTSIGEFALRGCTGLMCITTSGDNTMYDSRNNCNAIIESKTNTLIYGCSSTVIPNSVTCIGSYAFFGCTGLTSINIPDSVTSICNNSFKNCPNLKTVTLNQEGVNQFQHSFDINATEKVILKDSVTSIGWQTFKGCTGLTSIDIPDSVTSINWYAFEGCTGLTSITIPGSVTSIGGYAFEGCTGLTSITIPDSVTSIGSSAFEGCKNVSDVYYSIKDMKLFCSVSETAYRIRFKGAKYYFLYNGNEITDLVIPDSVTNIESGVFKNISGIKSIIIPKSVEKISAEAFSGCTSLTSLTVDSENRLFDSRDNCNAVIDTRNNKLVATCAASIIPNSVTCIGASAFNGCVDLTEIDIPDSVTSIEEKAFFNCINLKSVTIPSTVTEIGDKAFGYYSETGTDEDKKLEGFTVYCYNGSEGYDYGWYNYFDIVKLEQQTESTEPVGTESTESTETQPVTNKPTDPTQPTNETPTEPTSTEPTTPTETQSVTDNLTDPTQPVEKKDISDWEVIGLTNKIYTGKPITQKVAVTNGTDYAAFDISYKNNVNAGNATVIIKGKGNYTGTIVETFKITKAKNPITVKTAIKTVKLSKVKKAKQTVKPITVSKAQGNVTYKLKSVPKALGKLVKISSKGAITISKWKKAKSGSYKIKVVISAKGNDNYKSQSVNKTVTIKIK